MRNLGMRLPGSRGFTLALFWLSTGILLSASSCVVQQPRVDPNKAWADLTWEERYYLDRQQYQEMGEHRRTGCPKKRCG